MKQTLCIVLFCISTVLAAQQKKESAALKLALPESIYMASFDAALDSLNQSYSLMKEFNTSINFLKYSYIDLNRGIMTVPLQKFSELSTVHFFETYQKLHEQSYFRQAFEKTSGNKFFDIHNYKERFNPKH